MSRTWLQRTLLLHVLRLANGCQIDIFTTTAASADRPVHDTDVAGHQQPAIVSEVGFTVMANVASAPPLRPGANCALSGDAVEQLPKMAVDGTPVLQHIKLEESIAVVRFVTHAAAAMLPQPSLQPVPRLHIHGNMLQHRS